MTEQERESEAISRRRFLAYSLGGLSAVALGACSAPAAPAPAPAAPAPAPAAPAPAPAKQAPAAAAPAPAKQAPAAKAPAVVTPAEVSVTYIPIVSLVALFCAEDAGFFKEQGIKTTFKNINLYTVLPLIAKGDEDTGIGATAPAFFNAANSGLDLKAVADRLMYLCSSDNHLVVRKDLFDSGAVRKPEDLKGKNMTILARGSATEYWHSLFLKKYKFAPTDVKLAVLGFPEMLTALKTKAIDSAYIAEPQLTQALDEGVAERLLPLYRLLLGEQTGQMVFSGKFIRERTDVAQRYVNAFIQGIRYYQDPKNKSRVQEITVKWTKVADRIIEKMYGGDSWPWMDPNGEVAVQRIFEGAGRWMVEEKLITKLPKVEEFYDDRFVKEAARQLGRVTVSRTC